MKQLPSSRVLISILLMVLFLIFIVAILFITNLSFSVWEQLQQKPQWLIWTYATGLFLISIIFGRVIWRLLIPKSRKKQKSKEQQLSISHNIEATTQRLDEMSQKLLSQNKQAQKKHTSHVSDKQAKNAHSKADESKETSLCDEIESLDFSSSPELMALQAELKDYAQRKSENRLYIALFGDISCGKSTVIKALISSQAQTHSHEENSYSIQTGVIGGTTREVTHYHWTLEINGIVQNSVLTDMPGLNEQFSELDILATEEVQRAHIAIYLCDGDLSATQFSELKRILQLHKPCVVAINKADRYTTEELNLIIESVKQRIEPMSSTTPVLTINAGGVREFIRLTHDGEEERVQRPIQPDIKSLQGELLKMIKETSVDQLEQLREKSVSSMLNDKLDDVEARFKHSQSKRLVSDYTKKAVIASMATISPGTDLLVQGYLGIQMVKDLCQLYDVAATDIDANKLIELIQSRMDKSLPLLLAIAGNGFKAFPGIGTVSGGLMHAVAYGMIFDTLGHSVARTLEVTGELSPSLISDLYKEQLGENIESRTKDFIKLVLKLRNSD